MKALNPTQRLAVQLVARGLGRTRVAFQLKIDPGTLSRWRRLPEFKNELEKLLNEFEAEGCEQLRAIRTAAIDRLASLVGSPNPNVALKAIQLLVSEGGLTTERVIPQDAIALRERAQWDRLLDEVLMADE